MFGARGSRLKPSITIDHSNCVCRVLAGFLVCLSLCGSTRMEMCSLLFCQTSHTLIFHISVESCFNSSLPAELCDSMFALKISHDSCCEVLGMPSVSEMNILDINYPAGFLQRPPEQYYHVAVAARDKDTLRFLGSSFDLSLQPCHLFLPIRLLRSVR